MKWWFTPAMALFIAGCASTPQQCDPNQPGLFNNASCLGSGSYQQRLDQRGAQLQQEQSATTALLSQERALEQEQRATRETLVQQQRELATLQRRNDDLRRQLTRAEARTQQQQAQKTRLQAELDRMDGEIRRLRRSGTNSADLGAQVRALEQRRDQLAIAIATLAQ